MAAQCGYKKITKRRWRCGYRFSVNYLSNQRLFFVRVQLIEDVLQLVQLLPSLTQLALRGTALIVGEVSARLRDESVLVCRNLRRWLRCRCSLRRGLRGFTGAQRRGLAAEERRQCCLEGRSIGQLVL